MSDDGDPVPRGDWIPRPSPAIRVRQWDEEAYPDMSDAALRDATINFMAQVSYWIATTDSTAVHAEKDVTFVPFTIANEHDAVLFANELKSLVNDHYGDVAGHTTVGSHLAADDANVVPHDDVVNLTSAIELANAIKTAVGNHMTQSGVHFHDDANETLSEDDCTDFETLKVLLLAVAQFHNRHVGRAVVSPPIG